MADSIHGKISPLRVGILMDIPTEGSDPTKKSDFYGPLRMLAEEAHADGRLERPIEFVVRQANGLPNGSFMAVERAFDELVAEDCLIIFGPVASENSVPMRDRIEAVGRVACISVAGSEELLGEWFFALNNGSLEEEPVMLAEIMRHDGYKRIALATERSLIGDRYARSFRRCAKDFGLDVVGEVFLPTMEADKAEAVKELQAINPDAMMHCGLGIGLFGFTKALRAVNWDLPRYASTAFEYAHVNEALMKDMGGWIGLESYDERNTVGQDFMKRFEKWKGAPIEFEYLVCLGIDVGQVIVKALSNAKPLTGKGVKEALEQVKFIPAASGGPGTKLRFGKYMRQGWVGIEYLVARRILPDGSGHVFHGSVLGTRGAISTEAFDYPAK